MKELLSSSVFIGVLISLVGYQIGAFLNKKFKVALLNPLLLAIIFVIIFLWLTGIDYETYNKGAGHISYLLTMATICLAIPLYEELELLKKNVTAIVIGIFAGTLTGLISILLMAIIFHLNHQQYVTLLPKSITTAIGIGVSEKIGGMVTITVAVIIITGILGNVIAEGVFKLFRIHHPIAKGVALGTSSHAIGTAKAIEIGKIEGAMSSLSIAIAGLITVIGASIFSFFF